jgi:hypothetical protein
MTVTPRRLISDIAPHYRKVPVRLAAGVTGSSRPICRVKYIPGI